MATGSEGLVALARKRNQQSLRSNFRHLMLKKGQVLSESCFKNRIYLLLQWVSPSKFKGLEEPLQKGKPETATAQSQEAVKSTSSTKSRAVEAQTLVTAVEQILKEKMVLHYALVLNWYKV